MDIDTDELLASLTPREENPAIKTYQNTVSVACPACEEPFDDLVVCKQNPTSLSRAGPRARSRQADRAPNR